MRGITNPMRDSGGAEVSIDWVHHLVHEGRLHRINHKLSGISATTGCNFIIDIPKNVELHWGANYFSKFGGLLEATKNPTISAIGTEIQSQNCRAELPSRLKTKFYHTATATANTSSFVYNVGIPGGTAVAGNGAAGSDGDRAELILDSGRWIIIIKPYADSADIILNALVYEGIE